MEKILEYLNEQKDEIVNMLCNFVKIPTVNPPGKNYVEMSDLLQIELSKIDLDIRRIIVPGDYIEKKGLNPELERINLFANWNVDADTTLHFNSHYDVVPAFESNWETNPFKPVIKNGRVYGRGTVDMKGSIVSLIYAIKAMREFKIKPNVNIQISITCDEETGGELGMGYFTETENLKGDIAIGEGPSSEYISLGNKGVLWAEIEIIGQSAHAALSPKQGKNAFERMIEVAQEYLKLKDVVINKQTKYKTIDNEQGQPSMVLGGNCSGGDKINTVPGKASFTIDRRLIPEETIEEARKELLSLAAKLEKENPNFKINVNFIYEDAPVWISEDTDFVKKFSELVERICENTPKYVLLAGATDLRYLIKKGIPAIGYSPKGGNHHADNEYVEIKSLIDTAAIYYLFMKEYK